MNKDSTALAMGAFDGLHIGHINVIKETVKLAGDNLLPSVLTFKEDPDADLKGETSYIISPEIKSQVLKEGGIKQVFMLDFKKIKEMSPKEFFQKIVLEKCKAKMLFCGDNFRFGKNASGDTALLKEYCENSGITLCVVPYSKINEKVISSTAIRQAIENGDMELVKKMLGRNYSLFLEVVYGNKIGRTLGAPTINQIIPKGYTLPKFGVYASFVSFGGKTYKGVTNIGVKPSIKGSYSPSAETYILDFEGDLYGKTIKTELVEFIRPEKKFDSLESLKVEINLNAQKARKLLE